MPDGPPRFGTVAIVGRTNVGKSTFLNAALGEKLAIVSAQPQTTRERLLGVAHRPSAQIAFTDTPGLHRPKTELGRRMNAAALDTAKNHDVVLFVTDVQRTARIPEKKWRPDEDPVDPDDRRLVGILRPDVPAILVLNKVDMLHDKTRLLPLIRVFSELHPFAAIVPTTFLKQEFVDTVLDEIEKLLPAQAAAFDAEVLTDRPMTFFVREFVREQVLQQTRREVPHAVAVTVDRFEEAANGPRVMATIHVEKAGQRSILVGKGGAMIKSIGMSARQRLAELFGTPVHLELFVRVTERWKDVPRQLQEMGYDAQQSRELSSVLPARTGRSFRRPRTKEEPRKAGSNKTKPPRSSSAARGGQGERNMARSAARKQRGATGGRHKPSTHRRGRSR
jgi:GTPase